MSMPGRLRDWCSNIRRKPAPIADAVPMVQQAADRIEHLERVLAQARDTLKDGNMDMVHATIAAIDEALRS